MPHPFGSLFVVKGDSMSPTLQHGDLILISPAGLRLRAYQRGAVVAARIPSPGAHGGSIISVRRVVGLPGEFVRVSDDGSVRVEDQLLDEPYLEPAGPAALRTELSWLCADDEYVLMGDNRADSWDSRAVGTVAASNIIGRVWLRLPTRRLAGHRRRDADASPRRDSA